MLVLLLLQQRSINGDSQSLIDKLRKELLILGHEQFSKEALLLAPYCKQIFAANSIHDFLYKNLFDIFGKYDGENGSFRSLMFYCCKEYDLKSNSMPTELMLPLDLVHTLIDSKLASPALESALRRLEEIITIMQKYDFSPIFSVNVDVMAMTSIEASELSLMV
ncbi:MAG: hypothetical protein HWD59_05315 [Coxiellaceae bacterium]|nr:MAG: hypothetical protein HWD59_05315 [Coxiellaceae bacterium]